MKHLWSKMGFSMLEAIASVAIIALVFTTAIATITAMRNQTNATENKRVAVDMASTLRDDLIRTQTYASLSTWLGNEEKTIDSTSCMELGSPISCDLFSQIEDASISSDQIIITFHAPTLESQSFQTIKFSITITYYKVRTITLEGVIYA